MSKENGGPAFPVTQAWDEKFCDEAGYARTRRVSGLAGGVTLRDWFAAKARQGLLASGCLTQPLEGMARPFNEHETADQCYAMADAMLAERSKP